MLFKCVAGCNGMNASKTANELEKLNKPSLDEIYEVCIKNDFGCRDCLVVQSENSHIFDGDCDYCLSKLYITKFKDPRFNPRWELGTAPYVEVIELNLKE